MHQYPPTNTHPQLIEATPASRAEKSVSSYEP